MLRARWRASRAPFLSPPSPPLPARLSSIPLHRLLHKPTARFLPRRTRGVLKTTSLSAPPTICQPGKKREIYFDKPPPPSCNRSRIIKRSGLTGVKFKETTNLLFVFLFLFTPLSFFFRSFLSFQRIILIASTIVNIAIISSPPIT